MPVRKQQICREERAASLRADSEGRESEEGEKREPKREERDKADLLGELDAFLGEFLGTFEFRFLILTDVLHARSLQIDAVNSSQP